MSFANRRQFLADLGRGMLIAGAGPALASQLGAGAAFADEGPASIRFGALEPLVALLQETPAARLQPLLVDRLKAGATNLEQLVAAAALANARSFGGEDYVGFHTMMALVPALTMARELPQAEQPLPVLKVLYRNSDQIQSRGGKNAETLRPVSWPTTSDQATRDGLQQATRAGQLDEAERAFAGLCRSGAQDGYNGLQPIVEDEADVHRVVLAHRAWSLLGIVGQDHAHTMLRQSVRYCVKAERQRLEKNRPEPAIRALLPKLIDQHKLLERPLGDRSPDDAWLDRTSLAFYGAARAQAAEMAAGMLAEGISPAALGEALSLAANLFVLRDQSPRTHGDSAGVHASDSMHAWRGIAAVTDRRNAVASLIVAAYHVAESSHGYKDKQSDEPWPLAVHREKIASREPVPLLREAEEAIRANDQARAAAAMYWYCQSGAEVRPAFDLLLKYSISEDGRLHAEKYYCTASDEFARTRTAFRNRQLISLARVTASSYGYDRFDKHGTRAPGYEEARKLLGV